MDSEHVFEEHTGEVRVRLHARRLPELYAEAGRALAELMSESPPEPDDQREEVVVHAADREALLAEFINELIFRSETSKKIYGEFAVELPSDRELRATIRGGRVTDLRTAVKAATLHDLRIVEEPRGFWATVLLDV
ncbi:MAG: archease [Polyangiales bacterium]